METKTKIQDTNYSDVNIKFNTHGLVPAIAQDAETGEVLMLAYMNKEAFDLTVKTGKGTYFSRSRQSLWIKGETSGHYQYVQEIRYDCDADTILLLIKQEGAACHTNNYSCFYRRISDFNKAEEK